MGTVNNLTLMNEKGETSINRLVSADTIVAPAQATGTFLGNVSGSSAVPSPIDASAVATALPATGITAKVLTGLVAGSNTPITATDTILQALANLQAQIDAL